MLSLSFLVALSAAISQSTVSALAPTSALCPTGFELTRFPHETPQTLGPDEAAYIAGRSANVLPAAWKSYLANVLATNVSLPDYVSEILQGDAPSHPTLGIASSGGGYRAAIFGAGVLNALDGRNATSASAGTGGLLQAATYLSGLSGGSWLVTSLAQANFPTIQDLLFGSVDSESSDYAGWLAQFNVLAPSDNDTINTLYVEGLLEEIAAKYEAGYPVNVVDVWARALSRHFVNGTTSDNFCDETVSHGVEIMFSDIANVSSFVSYNQPFPIVVADILSDSVDAATTLSGEEVSLTNPIIEFNPFEMGSYDPALSAFAPTKYLGTRNNSLCVTGYDQAGFIAGSSSALFNGYNTSDEALAGSLVGTVVAALEETFPIPGFQTVTALYPNPFYGVANNTFLDSNQTYLNLVDGGEDGEVMPLQPLLVKARGVDVIFAIDANADTDYNFADGSSLIATQDRVALVPSYDFPPVPTNATVFISENLTIHPTFFGCDSDPRAPLVIYLANGGAPAGQTPVTNTTTLQLEYDASYLQEMLDQTYTVATQGLSADGSAVDSEWPACLACAIVDRSRERTGIPRSGVCESCFGRYCWRDESVTVPSTGSSPQHSSFSLDISVSVKGGKVDVDVDVDIAAKF